MNFWSVLTTIALMLRILIDQISLKNKRLFFSDFGHTQRFSEIQVRVASPSHPKLAETNPMKTPNDLKIQVFLLLFVLTRLK